MSRGGKKKSRVRTTTKTEINETSTAVGDNRVLEGDGVIEGNLNLANTTAGSINASRTSIDNSVTNITDGGAFDLVDDVVDDVMKVAGDTTKEMSKVSDSSIKASSKNLEQSLDFGGDVVSGALAFGQEALMANNDALDDALDFGEVALEKVSSGLESLAQKSESITRSDSSVNVNTTMKYVTYGVGAVAVSFALYSVFKK